jgi:hypothetical protein
MKRLEAHGEKEVHETDSTASVAANTDSTPYEEASLEVLTTGRTNDSTFESYETDETDDSIEVRRNRRFSTLLT